MPPACRAGAGEGIRTLDPNLGKVVERFPATSKEVFFPLM